MRESDGNPVAFYAALTFSSSPRREPGLMSVGGWCAIFPTFSRPLFGKSPIGEHVSSPGEMAEGHFPAASPQTDIEGSPVARQQTWDPADGSGSPSSTSPVWKRLTSVVAAGEMKAERK